MTGGSPPPILTAKERRLLRRLARELVQAKLRELRAPPRKDGGWQRALHSPMATALITIILGGLMGQWITFTYQSRLKRQEMALLAYRDFLTQKQEAERRVSNLVLSTISATDDLITSTGKRLNPGEGEHGEEDMKIAAEQRLAVQRSYNDANRQWRIAGSDIGPLLKYYHEGSEEVSAAWGGVQNAVNGYMDCAEAWYEKYKRNPAATADTSSACQAPKDAIGPAMTHLTQTVEKTRTYLWRAGE